MKVKCIRNDDWQIYLTVDKTYEVIKEEGVYYKIIGDKGIENWFPKDWFKSLSEIRNETINKLLENES